MKITTENISPKIAEVWLNANKSNRKLRTGVVEKYAADMAAGAWTTCPAPIVFYEDGDLADGQHRLWAIMESHTTQTFLVARGLSREAGLNIDTGLGRSLVDNARISGVGSGLSNEMVAVGRACEVGNSTTKALSGRQRIEMVDKHREAVEWAVANGPRGKGLRNAVTLAAVARAWYHEDNLDKLRRFGDVMSTGFMDGESESAAVAFRNYLQDKGPVATSSAMWRDTFLKAQNAISYFMRDKKLTIIKGVQEEAYPLKRRAARKSA